MTAFGVRGDIGSRLNHPKTVAGRLLGRHIMILVTELPIWRVFQIIEVKNRKPLSQEGTWEQTWKEVMALREENPTNSYDCDTSIEW